MISQLYGGGGNAGATLKNDFIEIINHTGAPIDLSGWSVQFASATVTTNWTVTPLTNFVLQPGENPPEAVIASVRSGLYVTELIGFGVNPVTGDYSRGAAGLWIENGELAYPVEELTIAGNLREMLRDVEMVGNDLALRDAVASPTLKIGRMTVAGS